MGEPALGLKTSPLNGSSAKRLPDAMGAADRCHAPLQLLDERQGKANLRAQAGAALLHALAFGILVLAFTRWGLDQIAATHSNPPDLFSCWMNLKPGFENHHKPPVVRVDGGGRYAFSAK